MQDAHEEEVASAFEKAQRLQMELREQVSFIHVHAISL